MEGNKSHLKTWSSVMSLRPESRLASICLRKQAGREEFTTLTVGKSGLISRSRIWRLTDNQQRVLSTVPTQISSIAQLLLAPVLPWRWSEGTYRNGSPGKDNRKPPATTWIWPINSVGLFPVLPLCHLRMHSFSPSVSEQALGLFQSQSDGIASYTTQLFSH